MGPFDQLKEEEIERIVRANSLHVIYMSKLMVNQFLQRYQTKGVKSAIVVPVSDSVTHDALNFVAEGLKNELSGKIDVLSHQAGVVKIKNSTRSKPDPRK